MTTLGAQKPYGKADTLRPHSIKHVSHASYDNELLPEDLLAIASPRYSLMNESRSMFHSVCVITKVGASPGHDRWATQYLDEAGADFYIWG